MSNSRINDLIDLNEVPRWSSRVRLIRRQTVAEHTFSVMAIAYEIVIRLDVSGRIEDKNRMLYWVLRWALVHDGPECETGDVNYLFKKNFDRALIHDMEETLCPWYAVESREVPSWAKAVVKIADKVEEYLYITKWTTPGEAGKWVPLILDQIVRHVADAILDYGWQNIPAIVCDVLGVPISVSARSESSVQD